MPLSDFLDKFNPLEKSSSAGEFYLCLVISDKKVKSGIFSSKKEKNTENAPEISFGSTENWGGESAEELIVVADTSIASAISKLPEVSGNQPTKIVLGLPENWIEGNSIKTEKLILLEKVSKKLLLKPQGFMITAEAISHYLKRNEGGLPSVILVSLEESEVAISLINAGKFLGTKIVGRSDNLALDLEEGLLRFDYKENLPSRILLFDGVEDLEEAKQSLISYPWIGPESEKKFSFLQLPKVETTSSTFEISAVVFASSQEFNGALVVETAPETKEIKKEVVIETEVYEQGLPPQEMNEEDFGFVKGKDIVQEQKEEISNVTNITGQELRIATVIEEEPSGTSSIKQNSSSFLKTFFGKLKKSPGKLPEISFSFLPKRIFVVAAVIILLFGAVSFGILALVKDEVKIFVKTQKIEKSFDFSVLPKISEIDLEKMVLPAREVTVDVSGEKTVDVVGKKTVGDKSTGDILIYNGTDKSKKFLKGTIVKTSGNLKFTINDEVTVASKSADLKASPPVEKWGEAKVGITALEIGAQYNITSDSNLTIEGTTGQYLVKNPSAFSGGTSREIQAVSKEDREKLQKALSQELEEKAKEEIKNKISAGDSLLSDSLILKNKVDRFNHEINDEATRLTLEESAQFSTFFLKQDDFALLVDKTVSPLIATGYQKTPVKDNNTFDPKDKVKGIYTAKISQENLPQINEEQIKKDLRLKTFSQAEKYLKSLDQIAGIEISVEPKILSSFLRIMPIFEKNINIVVVSN